MTNTETITRPSNVEIRHAWLDTVERDMDMFRRSHGPRGELSQLTSGEWLFLLERIRTEGPSLARPDKEQWNRRFRWINRQISRKVDIDYIVRWVLIDMRRVAD